MVTLENSRGVTLTVLARGGVIGSLRVPDRAGRVGEVVLGFDRPERYEQNRAYLGALIGRYANRIAGARFAIDGRTYALATNDGAHHLHGGRRGFDRADWRLEPFRAARGSGVVLEHASPDGDEGYPGALRVRVVYVLTDANDVVIESEATTDRPTHVNLTQHSYFNLAGGGDVLGHLLEVNADRFTPVDETLIPTGELRAVAGTPFDFRRPTPIGARIADEDEQLRRGRGYDHNFVLNGAGQRFAARLRDPESGRALEIHTTEPGLQVYTGNFLDEAGGRGGAHYGRHAGVALETQHFPDAPNRPDFPATLLRPGVPYRSRTVWRFSAR